MNYFIAFSGRTGSGMLSNYLITTRRLGTPVEYFNLDRAGKLCGGGRAEQWGCQGYPDYYSNYLECTATPNGVTGAFVAFDHWARLLTGLAHWPKADAWAWLRRRDKLRQAISRYKVYATGQVHLRAGETQVADPPFNAEAIIGQAMRYQVEEAAWTAQFNRLQIEPVCIWYEELSADPVVQVKRIADAFGIELDPARTPTNNLVRQANAVTEAWYQDLLPTWQRISAPGKDAA